MDARASLAAAVVAAFALSTLVSSAGCETVGPTPPLSVAQFVPPRGPTGGHLEVTASAGDALTSVYGTLDGFPAPIVEGSVSTWLAKRYQATAWVSASEGVAGVTGQLVVVDGPLRVGLLHGAGIGFVPNTGDPDHPHARSVPALVTLGVELDVRCGARVRLFVVPRLALSVGAIGVSHMPVTGYDLLSAGVTIDVGRFRISPAIVLAAGTTYGVTLGDAPTLGARMAGLTVSFSSGF